MILLRRILPFLSPALLAFFFLALILNPFDWQLWVTCIGVTGFATVLMLTHWRILTADFWAMLFPVAGMLTGGTGILFFADFSLLQWAIAGVLVFLFALYTENIFVFYYQPQKYTALSLPNLSFFINVFAAFGLFSFAFALKLINLMSVWMIVAIGAAYAFLFLMHVLWSYKLLNKQNAVTIFALGVVMTQLMWVLQYWPVSFFVNGIVIAMALFVIASMLQLSLRNVLEKKVLWQYLGISTLGVAAVLLTTKWIV